MRLLKFLIKTCMNLSRKEMTRQAMIVYTSLTVILGGGWVQEQYHTRASLPSQLYKLEGKEKKLLFVIECLHVGGAERAFIEMIRLLPLKSEEFDLCILRRGGRFEKSLPSEIKIISLNDVRQKFYETIVSYSPNTDPAIIANIPGRRRIQFVHCDVGYPDKPVFCIRNQDKANLLDHIVCVSEVAAKNFRTYKPQWAHKVCTIRHCFDSKRIKPLSQAPQRDIPSSSQQLNVLSVGRLTWEKGFDRAIRVHKRLNDEGFNFRWYIVGEGDLWSSLGNQVRAAGLQGKFILLGLRVNPYPYMKASDLFVLSSYTETGPLVTLESLSAGCPVLSTRVGESATQINSGVNGIVVDNSEQALYDGLKMWLKSSDVRQTYRTAANKFVYDNSGIIKDLMKLFLPQQTDQQQVVAVPRVSKGITPVYLQQILNQEKTKRKVFSKQNIR